METARRRASYPDDMHCEVAGSLLLFDQLVTRSRSRVLACCCYRPPCGSLPVTASGVSVTRGHRASGVNAGPPPRGVFRPEVPSHVWISYCPSASDGQNLQTAVRTAFLTLTLTCPLRSHLDMTRRCGTSGSTVQNHPAVTQCGAHRPIPIM